MAVKPLLLRATISLGLIALMAAPTAAFDETRSKGAVGTYTVPDNPGVICHYEANPGQATDELDRIRIKPVQVTGPKARETWVGFQYILKANEKPLSDEIYRTVYKSPIAKSKASRTETVSFKGKYRTLENHRSAFQVHLVFYFYKPGSKTDVAGKTRGLVEVYRQRHPDVPTVDFGSLGDPGACGHKVRR